MKQKLLIIDDDRTILDALEMVLKAEGYDVVSAPSGEAGLKVFSDMSNDLVLLDWQLPGIQGREVLQKIREQSPHLPVIMMTAYGTSEMRQEVERLGAVAVISKPFGPEDILSLIADALAEAQGR